jgi:hypothetical protein
VQGAGSGMARYFDGRGICDDDAIVALLKSGDER